MSNETQVQELYPTLGRIEDLELRLYRLETKSHLRIGAGEGSTSLSAADLPIIRALWFDEANPDRRVPYLPASSLHGVIRSWCEKIVRSIPSDLTVERVAAALQENDDRPFKAAAEDLRPLVSVDKENPTNEAAQLLASHLEIHPSVCNPFFDLDKCERFSATDERREWKQRWYKSIGRQVPCEICRVFGFVGQRGKVRLTHAFPTTEHLPLDIITRVSINRLTGAADEGKLFDLEAVPPGTVFYFFTVMENMHRKDAQGKEVEKELFDKAIKALYLQLATLGAHSTVGFGMVEVHEVLRVTVNRGIFDCSLEEARKAIPNAENHILPEGLDQTKYPWFFLALAALNKADNQPALQGVLPGMVNYSIAPKSQFYPPGGGGQ